MAKFKFPGGYIEETPVSQNITSLSSVAVFIGYTEKHVNINGDNILRCSTTVSSVLEFENFFGTAPVSYTHLDVYKRQLQKCPERPLRRFRIFS